MAPKGADGRDLAGASPARDGLRVDAEHLRNLGRREQLIAVFILGHVDPSLCPIAPWKVRPIRMWVDSPMCSKTDHPMGLVRAPRGTEEPRVRSAKGEGLRPDRRGRLRAGRLLP